MEKVGRLKVGQFKAYHLRGKHGKSGPLEGSTILRRTICKGKMEKVGRLRVGQF